MERAGAPVRALEVAIVLLAAGHRRFVTSVERRATGAWAQADGDAVPAGMSQL